MVSCDHVIIVFVIQRTGVVLLFTAGVETWKHECIPQTLVLCVFVMIYKRK